MNFLVYLLFATVPLGQIVFYGHLYLLEIIIFLILICLPLLSRSKENRKLLTVDIVVFLFALSSLISVAVGSEAFYESARFYRQMVLLPVLLYFLIRLMPVSIVNLVKAFYFMIGTIFIQALYYFYFYFSYGTRPSRGTGIIISPITSSLFFCIGIFVVYYCRKQVASKIMRFLLMLCGWVFFVALVISATRAAFLGVFIAFFCIKLFWRTKKRRKLYYLLFMSFLFVFLGVVSLHSFGHHKVSLDRSKEREIQHSTTRLINPEIYLNDISERLSFWSYMARKVVLNRPFFGFGASSYHIGNIRGVGFSLGSVHNFLISSLITSGFFGLISLFFLIKVTFSCFVNAKEKTDLMIAFSKILQASFTVMILIALTNDLTGGRMNIFFFLVALSTKLSVSPNSVTCHATQRIPL